MSQFKNRELEKPINIILLSQQSQVSNAFATVQPQFTIAMYPSTMVGRNIHLPLWFESVFEHELNHIFQLSHSKTPKLIKKIFNLPSFLLFYFINPYPNIFLPTFVLEGDAVLKESILANKGGRLYNGDNRALVYSQIKHYQHQIPKFIKEKLLHLRMTAHSGQEKYLHGGYLMAMLAETYSHNIINSFFTLNKNTPSRKTIKQIKTASVKDKLSQTFAKVFSFQNIYYFLDDLAQAYFNHYIKQASHQKNSLEPALFKSFICPPFNRSGNELFFLTSHYRSVPNLKIFDIKTKKWTNKKKDLPLGKVFKIKGKYYSRSAKTIRPNTIHYSLFSEGIHSLDKFDSKYVEDMTNKNTLYVDTKNTLEGFKLYLNGQFYSYIHSNALLDQKENIYYFKQSGKKRILYKNKKPVFSYKGYYGNIMDIDSKGVVYFTASSPYGSSIYQHKNKTLSRSSSSDTIIQAKKINNTEFFVCEVTPFGYEYKIIPIERIAERPVLYKYRFKSRDIKKASYKNQLMPSKNILTSANRTLSETQLEDPRISATSDNTLFDFDKVLPENPLERRVPTSDKINNLEKRYTTTVHSADKKSRTSINNNSSGKENILKSSQTKNNKYQKQSLEKNNEKQQSEEIQYKEYSAFRNIHYSGVSAVVLWTGVISSLNGNVLFSDYLMHNQILLSYIGAITHPVFLQSSLDDSYFKMENQLLSAKYYNKTHRLNWNLGYTLLLRRELNATDSAQDSSIKYDHGGSLSFTYPLFKKGRWFSNVSSRKYMDWIEGEHIEASWTGSFIIGYSQQFPFLYAPRRAFISRLFLDYEAHTGSFHSEDNEDNLYEGGFKTGLNFNSTLHLGSDFYLFPALSYVMSFHPHINPARAFLYSASRGLRNPNNPSAYLSYSYDDDIGLDPFTLYDTFGPLFRTTYHAHSIATTSLGLKKAFILPINWINLHSFIPLFRVRYIIFENLFAQDGLFFISKYKQDISPDDSIYRDLIRKNIDNTKELPTEQEIKLEEYTQWLEWTFGFELSFLMYQKIPLIIGFSLGFRTPIKFWEDNTPPPLNSNSDSEQIISGPVSDLFEQKTRNFLSPTFQFHLKVPL